MLGLQISPPGNRFEIASEPFKLLDGSFIIAGQVDIANPTALGGPAPEVERVITLPNGLFESSATFTALSQELIRTAWLRGERWSIARYSDRVSYTQEDHTERYMRVNEYASNRYNSPVAAVGHSRGCISAQAAHAEQPHLIERSVHIAPPGCNPLETDSQARVVTTLAAQAAVDVKRSLGRLFTRNPEGLSARERLAGLYTFGTIATGGIRHSLGNFPQANREVYEIVQNERISFMKGLVQLHEQTGATAVATCVQDVLCSASESRANLRAGGYTGEIRSLEATHLDPVCRPQLFVQDIFQLVSGKDRHA